MKKHLKMTALLISCFMLVGLLVTKTVTIFAASENITSAGIPITSLDRGNLSVIIDGYMPDPVYSAGDTTWSTDTFGDKEENVEDYYGIQFQQNYVFTELVFQEGCHFDDGGWFSSYRIEVLQNDTWVTAQITNDPEYPEDEDDTRVPFGDNFETYIFELAAIEGSAIRIIGLPGGSGKFISCSEIEVYGSISEEPSIPADNDPPKQEIPPQTGDSFTIGAILSMVLTGFGIVTCNKKRK